VLLKISAQSTILIARAVSCQRCKAEIQSLLYALILCLCMRVFVVCIIVYNVIFVSEHVGMYKQ